MFRVLVALGIFFVGLGALFLVGGAATQIGRSISLGIILVTAGLAALALCEINHRLQKLRDSMAALERRQNQIMDVLLRLTPPDSNVGRFAPEQSAPLPPAYTPRESVASQAPNVQAPVGQTPVAEAPIANATGTEAPVEEAVAAPSAAENLVPATAPVAGPPQESPETEPQNSRFGAL